MPRPVYTGGGWSDCCLPGVGGGRVEKSAKGRLHENWISNYKPTRHLIPSKTISTLSLSNQYENNTKNFTIMLP